MNWFLITDKDFDGALISNVEDSNGVLIRNIGERRKDISSGRIATTRERERERERERNLCVSKHTLNRLVYLKYEYFVLDPILVQV